MIVLVGYCNDFCFYCFLVFALNLYELSKNIALLVLKNNLVPSIGIIFLFFVRGLALAYLWRDKNLITLFKSM
ncbi:hypothetical protein COX24_00625 [bacterium (Candidatus Gribaldobacteria) CG23_combo_of_CG06-09_8_20_14_all_37_87_8]|uniref:Uncharacterized protein n=2 Tax=Candidatus Gribaldobacteria TaxID=2798536 RepID=A0A2G9ZFP1_9BACT|nr:MAG: hypothetical protein AUJ25_01350 [Parcubacteria group bacterium CG1_02_37_13]PIP31983.1 MAG: hypothetical protein COX24_00625 [bacterium (Candidatus Gribaldobacteria) CG23_combo_of_CG06-09_8_20_14_all_37_87_8]PIR90755.1 MAG: hypothetical protein COU05_00370 [bacterium (Candidatus Gribaldobacteria) CG10_big_fil_rev_8_21_14_0_10_37_21]